MPHRSAIHVVDTHLQRPGFDAAYLIIEGDRAAFVDCGTSLAVPYLLDSLRDAGLSPADVDWLILTHVHLDHAGGAGMLLRQLPNARVVVHPRGAPHLIDPTRLIAGATAVYGPAAMAASYGEIVAVPEARVEIAGDGHVVDLAGRPLVCVDTPGHARHHLCVWDARSRSWFTGDTFGISYRELDTASGAFIIPSSSPVQFEPDALCRSLDRLLEREPLAMYLTHYGKVGDVAALAVQLKQQIAQMVALGQACASHPQRHEALLEGLRALYLARARGQGCGLPDARIIDVLATDIELNAQGLGCWLDRA